MGMKLVMIMFGMFSGVQMCFFSPDGATLIIEDDMTGGPQSHRTHLSKCFCYTIKCNVSQDIVSCT